LNNSAKNKSCFQVVLFYRYQEQGLIVKYGEVAVENRDIK